MEEKYYCISRLTKNQNGLIQEVDIHEVINGHINHYGILDRNWMIEACQYFDLKQIEKIENGKWKLDGDFNYDGAYFKWARKLPLVTTRHKTFLSYYHYDDQEYKEKFTNLFNDLIIAKSVNDGDIDSDNSDEYIKKLIQQNHLEDSTILIVLLGPNTKHRKHVDWEISGALNLRVGDKYSGVLGLKLPTHQDYGTGNHTYLNLPERLSENLKSDYAIIRDWTDDRILMQEYIELAFNKRNDTGKIKNSLPQMKENTNE
ncbi:TIR domain-containing protein [Flavobacterium sp. XS2P24]|uniref:TIR domain-containing protein n=1 Tax=Flavobacterium sp. XS2P24 TaxID=3041249 RepID=UPI0024A9E53B|nr:TIR domain-containing protein [Flavobacterium sp. XS2P24]MDI6050575.1 TIR domain-containing protein [Flavobacterium sp. XS2P24]